METAQLVSQISLSLKIVLSCNPAIQTKLSQLVQVCRHTRSIALNPSSLIFRFQDEIALYDRQIRLWGVKAQER